MTKEQLIELKGTGKYDIAPVSREILADIKTPLEVLKVLKKASGHCYLLESVADNENWGRYTFLGYDPKLEITCLNGVLKLSHRKLVKDSSDTTDDTVINTKEPERYIRKVLSEHKSPRIEELPPFTGGLVGYFAYDYIKYVEPTLDLKDEDKEGFNDVDLMLFDKVIAFDHLRQKMVLIVNIHLNDIESEYKRAVAELDDMENLIRYGEAATMISGHATEEFKPAFSKEEFSDMVNRAKQHIVDGDIFQIVLSNPMSAEFTGSLLNTYRMLRTINPSPYMFYFSSNDMEVAGASPETLVKLKDGVLHTFPLAGTRPRGKSPKEDENLKEELLKDPKELAEHNMLVDLGRNDLGRISKFGTVEVESLRDVLMFSHVMHIGSTVRGIIRDDEDALSAVSSILPAGTLSGAPKIKACELIHELEGQKRGIYGGAIGYIDFTGNLDTCIAIRIAYKKNGKVYVRSGAGIVADSVPETEYRECLNKAAAVVKAIELAKEVI